MSLLYVLIASLCAASVNYCLRKNLEEQKSPSGYLTIYFAFSVVISFLVQHIKIQEFTTIITSIGALAGLLNFLMMVLVARSLQLGPPGLVFAFQNSASVLPTFLLFFIFGPVFDFVVTLPALGGFCLIILGLFLSVRKEKSSPIVAHLLPHRNRKKEWLTLVILVFLVQGLILFLFQYRALLLVKQPASHPFLPWSFTPKQGAWFMPGFFFFPTLLQAMIFIISETRWPTSKELLLGAIGGVFNGLATFFLLLGSNQATKVEKLLLFPLFAISVIFLCNLWAKILYKEKIYWPGMALCFSGVFVSAL